MFKRVLIKLSGEALAGDSTYNYDIKTVKRVVKEIQSVQNNGTQVCLVVGGGNIWRGRSANEEMDRTKADEIGMLATVMNAIYLADSFRVEGSKAVVMTPFLVGTMTIHYSKDLADEYLNKGYIVIFAGGLGHPFFSTDTIAALRASELSCDCILYAKNIDGIYDSDPNKNENAIRFLEITYKEIIEKDLGAIDITAMSLCKDNKIPAIAFDMRVDNGVLIASKNDDEVFKIGTKIKIS